MQTFLPYPDFAKSARVLDYRRLGKQRVECKQILNALLWELNPYQLRPKKIGWVNHPATRMWKDYECALCEYAIIVCEEWISRGYKDTLLPHFQEVRGTLVTYFGLKTYDLPYWLGDIALHLSHQSNLLRKDWDYYLPVFRTEGLFTTSSLVPYYWPPPLEEYSRGDRQETSMP